MKYATGQSDGFGQEFVLQILRGFWRQISFHKLAQTSAPRSRLTVSANHRMVSQEPLNYEVKKEFDLKTQKTHNSANAKFNFRQEGTP